MEVSDISVNYTHQVEEDRMEQAYETVLTIGGTDVPCMWEVDNDLLVDRGINNTIEDYVTWLVFLDLSVFNQRKDALTGGITFIDTSRGMSAVLALGYPTVKLCFVSRTGGVMTLWKARVNDSVIKQARKILREGSGDFTIPWTTRSL